MRIIFRPLLVSGMYAEQSFSNTERADDSIRQEIEAMAALGVRPIILIDSEQPDEQKRIALWHEILHMIIVARTGKMTEHDEVWIEDAAKRLALAVPELLDKIGDEG